VLKLGTNRFRFGQFTLDPADRVLSRGGERIDLSSRYLDALVLMLREPGRLITKDRFMAEVWAGIPVTDEALTQCIRTLRRRLSDDAARPSFIETVPKHGYRFIADVDVFGADAKPGVNEPLQVPARTALAAGLGGAFAGIFGGLFYGLAGAAAGVGAVSLLAVMMALGALLGLLAGLGVGGGIAIADRFVTPGRWQAVTFGGLLGGLLVGGLVKLVGLDAFSALIGRAPSGMTGAAEGAMLGAAIGLAVWFGRVRSLGAGRSAAVGAVVGAFAGLLVPLLGGHLLGGSLDQLVGQFPDAGLRLDSIGGLAGDRGFGQRAELATATLEGALFGLGVAGALALVRRSRAAVS